MTASIRNNIVTTTTRTVFVVAVSCFVVVLLFGTTIHGTGLQKIISSSQTRSKLNSLHDNNNNNNNAQRRILKSTKTLRSKLGHIIDETFDTSSSTVETEVHQLDIHGNDTIDTTTTAVSAAVNIADTEKEDNNNNNDDDDDENATIQSMVQQLAPKELRFTDETNSTVVRHQFLHLHHMKTGGTSMDRLIHCAKDRYVAATSRKLDSYSIHECSEGMYKQCVEGTNQYCRNSIANTSILSYCAPLKDLQNPFGWTEVEPNDPNKIHAVTVFRHPVARAWSMYRYSTKRCYGCRPLKEVYELIDQNSTAITNMCKNQLSNHLTRNVLSNESITDETLKVQNAIENMKSFFTMVGLTEDMNATAIMVGKVFPWLAETIPGSTKVCKIEHANASPQNNMCGPNNSHKPIPDTPDDETAEIIRQHNQLDMLLYDAAVEQFRIQKLALRI